ncbi:hypothetical protein ColKHC_07368 [Colletotrichum higginsianum]|nr:hypothetical protein ColKHC_07368 [Colletotrichum higginsianum]
MACRTIAERGSSVRGFSVTYSSPDTPLDDKPVLEHDQVPFTGLETHEPLEFDTEGIEEVPAEGRRLVGEEPDPSKAVDNSMPLFVVGEPA